MSLISGKNIFDFVIECNEVFLDESINLNDIELDTNIKRYILSLQLKINNLSGQIEKIKEQQYKNDEFERIQRFHNH